MSKKCVSWVSFRHNVPLRQIIESVKDIDMFAHLDFKEAGLFITSPGPDPKLSTFRVFVPRLLFVVYKLHAFFTAKINLYHLHGILKKNRKKCLHLVNLCFYADSTCEIQFQDNASRMIVESESLNFSFKQSSSLAPHIVYPSYVSFPCNEYKRICNEIGILGSKTVDLLFTPDYLQLSSRFRRTSFIKFKINKSPKTTSNDEVKIEYNSPADAVIKIIHLRYLNFSAKAWTIAATQPHPVVRISFSDDHDSPMEFKFTFHENGYVSYYLHQFDFAK